MPRPSRTRSLRRHQRSTFSDRHTTHNRPLTSARAVCGRAGIFAAVACVRAENLNSDPAVCHVSRDVGRYKSPLTSSLSHEEARHVAQERPLHSSRPIPASHAHHKGHSAALFQPKRANSPLCAAYASQTTIFIVLLPPKCRQHISHIRHRIIAVSKPQHAPERDLPN